ncbi:MAG: hypothetical protein IAE65_04510 [Ignavibacteria bacterium]|nr:hypothetical protein [Ignavibacteria bacterium]
MVIGLEVFKEYFKNHKDKYIIIGGTACDYWITEAGFKYRATKDLDIILIIEVLEKDFVTVFWEFIKAGNYNKNEKSERIRKYYRFSNPTSNNFPYQIEIFSRKFDIKLAEGQVITPIPVTEDISSLSAIIMDDDYYNFVKSNSEIKDEINFANPKVLICLKASAYLDLLKKKNEGKLIDNSDIKKHRNDIIRLSAILTEEERIILPEKIKNDLEEFISILIKEPPDYNSISRILGEKVNSEEILNLLRKVFNLN